MKQEGVASKGYSVPNLERALEIVELLSVNSQGMTLSEIQECLLFPKSSVFRIVTTLVERGYLLKNQIDGKFSLSKKFLRIGLSTVDESSIVESSLPYMRSLRDSLKETILLGTIIEKRGVVLEQVVGNHGFTFMLTVGKPFYLHSSAPGKAMIAFLPNEERDEIIDTITFESFNEKTISSKKAFLEELKVVKEKGFALDRAEELEGVHCVGAPVFNQYGYPIAAVWVTAPSARMGLDDLEEVGEKIYGYAMEISKLYGYDI
ncbi:IclR family transcriptional regulator [Halosquirtibacter xylanolyticus]|uniref:IclR family transcriptional regulator n=1 Tax=Halosquirtibacter xylanolyticus TaxID=3374599 RepID=UPI003748AB6E|nr:IclR family transcriptional regulator [Prolixibacteraceae bacterium]